MEGPTDEASMPTETNNNRSNDDRRMSGTMEHKVGKKTCPWTTAEAVNHTPPPPNDRRMCVRRKFSDLLKYLNPFAAISPQPDEDEETPCREKATA
jgi:hypothetical protein